MNQVHVVLHQGAFWSPEVVTATTLNYYPDEKDINCAFSYVEGTKIVLYVDYFNRLEQYLECARNSLTGNVRCVETLFCWGEW